VADLHPCHAVLDVRHVDLEGEQTWRALAGQAGDVRVVLVGRQVVRGGLDDVALALTGGSRTHGHLAAARRELRHEVALVREVRLHLAVVDADIDLGPDPRRRVNGP
jgi:hypothetical protein